MMKNIFTTLFFCLCFASYSQGDRVAMLKKTAGKKYGFSVFAGLGLGGSDLTKNPMLGCYAKTVSARFHYGMHTVNAYVSQVTSAEQPIFNRVSATTAFNMHNFGLSYGVGTYGKHFSAGCLVGVTYSSVTTFSRNLQILDVPSYYPVAYSKNKLGAVNACLGLHASVKTKYIGIGYQVYYNLFSQYSSFNAVLGIEVPLR